MVRSPLRPPRLVLLGLRLVWAEPLYLACYLLPAGMMLSVSAGGLSRALLPVSLLVSFMLTWLFSVPAIHCLASGCYQLDGGDRLSLSQLAGGSLRALPLALLAAFWASLLVLFGSLALLVGALVGWGLALWVLPVSILENRKGRRAVDRSFVLAGPGGIGWALLASTLGILFSSYLVLFLERLLGISAVVVYPPISAIFAMPFVVAAILVRRSEG